jgi:ribosomal protein L12E/L44/L45/RPP1/RPP2
MARERMDNTPDLVLELNRSLIKQRRRATVRKPRVHHLFRAEDNMKLSRALEQARVGQRAAARADSAAAATARAAAVAREAAEAEERRARY